MSLHLYFHPLASFCHKALIALYENDTPFEAVFVDLGKQAERAALLKLWPIGKFPVLRDDARDQTVPESTIIIEYLDRHYPGTTRSFRRMPTTPSRRGCAIASMPCTCTNRCRKSSATGCAPKAARIRMASRKPGRGYEPPTT